MFHQDMEAKWTFLLVWIIGSFFIYMICGRLKEVTIIENRLRY